MSFTWRYPSLEYLDTLLDQVFIYLKPKRLIGAFQMPCTWNVSGWLWTRNWMNLDQIEWQRIHFKEIIVPPSVHFKESFHSNDHLPYNKRELNKSRALGIHSLVTRCTIREIIWNFKTFHCYVQRHFLTFPEGSVTRAIGGTPIPSIPANCNLITSFQSTI